MPKINTQVQDIDSALVLEQPSFTWLPRVAAPFTTITNRAQVTDFANDGLPKMGIDRIITQSLVEVPGEYGPNGERVWRPINDVHNQVRCVGNWVSLNTNNGTFVSCAGGEYLEITFYGTALNILAYTDSIARSMSVSVNGGSASTVTNSSAGTLQTRNYASNTVIPLFSTPTVGLYTVRVTAITNSISIYGFETLNTASTIFLPPTTSYVGGRRLYNGSSSTTAFNSGFESGTLGTRGGHVLVYQKADGTIAKAVTPTNTSQANLNSADHTNEEVLRVYYPREFGAGRSDDFSSLAASASSRAFTLDDGTTTLLGQNLYLNDRLGVGYEHLTANTASDYFTFTFIGTGLDIDVTPSTAAATLTITVDGTSIGSMTFTTANLRAIRRVVSGLPYGTHTVRFVWATNVVALNSFITYVPRTPALPAGAVALADYFVMADYVLASSSQNPFVSQGVLRKMNSRELIYSGTFFAYSLNTFNQPFPHSGAVANSNGAGSYVEYTFFGTGIEFYNIFSTAASYDLSILVDGLALNAGSNAGSTISLTIATTTTAAGVANNGITLSAAGAVSGGFSGSPSQPGLIRISGLALGRHVIRVTTNITNNLSADCFGVITPIHAPKEIGPARLQNVSLIGSCGIRDLRGFAPQQIPNQKAWCRAVGMQIGNTSTNTSTLLPCPDLSTVIKTNGGAIQISYSAMAFHGSLGGEHQYRVFVNGVSVGSSQIANAPSGSSYYVTMAGNVIVPLQAGTHKVDVYWATNTGTLTQPSGNTRSLDVHEL